MESFSWKGAVMKTNRNILLPALALALLVPACVWAQSSVWEVRGPRTTVYLAGSCHVLRASDHPLPGEFDIAYSRARRLVFEAPPGDLDGPAYLQKLLAVAMYPDGTTLKQRLTPAVYAKAEKFCRARGYPFEQYQMLRPWMLSLVLTLQELKRIGVSAEYGVDRFFYARAAADGKAISGLETSDEQIGFLTLLDGDMGNDQVSETIDDLVRLESRVGDILNAWRKGDEAGIETVNLRELKNYPRLYEALIVNRNRKWAAKIETLLAGSESAMVIVGVGHLAGAESVVDLLRRRGFPVVRLQK